MILVSSLHHLEVIQLPPRKLIRVNKAVMHMQDTHVYMCLIVFLLLKTITKVSFPVCPLSAMVTDRILWTLFFLLFFSRQVKYDSIVIMEPVEEVRSVFREIFLLHCISGVSFNFNNILHR